MNDILLSRGEKFLTALDKLLKEYKPDKKEKEYDDFMRMAIARAMKRRAEYSKLNL